MTCSECNKNSNADAAFYKAIIKRKNRENVFLLVICLALIVGFTAYAIYTKWVDSQFETVSEDIRVISDDEGDANYIGNDGDIIYGGDNR